MAGVLAGADDGGATGVEAAGAEVVADAVVPAVEVGPVVALGLALLVVGDGPGGLYVIDVETKKRRLLVPGANMRMADWSAPLVRAEDLIVRR